MSELAVYFLGIVNVVVGTASNPGTPTEDHVIWQLLQGRSRDPGHRFKHTH